MKNKHPQALLTLIFTESAERYGFYIIQTLLAIFLLEHFNLSDYEIYAFVGSFTALTFISPFIGGFIADRFINLVHLIFLGAGILIISYLILALAVLDLLCSMQFIMLALSGVAIGTGLFKPNISSLLGLQYKHDSNLRESGFTLFYMGIVFGIILGSTLPLSLVRYFNWQTAFFSACLSMLLASYIFYRGVRLFNLLMHTGSYSYKIFIKVSYLLLITFTICFLVLCYPIISDLVFGLIVACALYFFVDALWQEFSKEQLHKFYIIGVLCLISVFFWTFYFQMFSSLTLLILRTAQPKFLGLDFPAPYYVSVQSLGAIFFGAIFASLAKNKFVSSLSQAKAAVHKFTLAMFFMLAAYAVIIVAIKHANAQIPVVYLIAAYLLIALAELHLYPVGLSIVTVLTNKKSANTMMGIFFVSIGLGGFLSGKMAKITALDFMGQTLVALKWHYAHAFSQLFYILLLLSICCLLLNIFVNNKYLNTGRIDKLTLRSKFRKLF